MDAQSKDRTACVCVAGSKLAPQRRQRGRRAVKEAGNKPNGETIDKQRETAGGRDRQEQKAE